MIHIRRRAQPGGGVGPRRPGRGVRPADDNNVDNQSSIIIIIIVSSISSISSNVTLYIYIYIYTYTHNKHI